MYPHHANVLLLTGIKVMAQACSRLTDFLNRFTYAKEPCFLDMETFQYLVNDNFKTVCCCFWIDMPYYWSSPGNWSNARVTKKPDAADEQLYIEHD